MFLALLLLASLTTQAGAPTATFMPATSQTETHYRIYEASGKALTIDDVITALDMVEVVCIGELHDDAAAHAFEAELFKRVLIRNNPVKGRTNNRPVALSLEMFERDVQVVLDEYLRGLINERHFLLSSRPWKNYEKDYRPLVELAREYKSSVIASNAPARYVNRVSRLGPDSLKGLTPTARAWLPPLPYPSASAAYAAKFKQLMTGTQMTGGAQAQPQPHGSSFLLDAQVLRDATMAFVITQQLKQRPETLIFHVNGSFHSEERLGVPEQIRHYREKTRTLVITIVSDKSYPAFDATRLGKLGDIVVVTDPQLSRSF